MMEQNGEKAAKRRKGSKTHLAVDTLGQLLALIVTPADEQDWAQIEALCCRGSGGYRRVC